MFSSSFGVSVLCSSFFSISDVSVILIPISLDLSGLSVDETDEKRERDLGFDPSSLTETERDLERDFVTR